MTKRSSQGLKKDSRAAGGDGPSQRAKRRDGTNPQDPVRIYADGKVLSLARVAYDIMNLSK